MLGNRDPCIHLAAPSRGQGNKFVFLRSKALLFALRKRFDAYQAKLKRAICFVVLVQTEFSNLTGIKFEAIELESSKLREKIREWNIDHARFVS
mgnify:CR=1 FL=1